MRLILNPGGCAVYRFPLEADQRFAMIHPARKAGVPWESYCPKGSMEVEVAAGDQKYLFRCFPDPEDCGSSACIGDFLSLLTENVTEVDLSLCVPETEVNTAAIWEINMSEVRL